QLVERGLEATGALTEAEADYGEGTVRRFQKGESPLATTTSRQEAATERRALPGWLRAAALPAEAVHTFTSSAPEARAPIQLLPSIQERRQAMLRGSIMHRLLQSLPDVATDRRRAA